MAQVGGKRAGAGRKPGKVSQAKRELMAMAKTHAGAALKALVEVAKAGESESARVAAANAILDRAYGKAPMAVIETDDAEAPALSINISAQAPVKDVRVTQSEG